MDYSVYKQTLTLLLLFAIQLTLAQKKYDSKVTEAQINLEGKSIMGFSTVFDFSREEVRYGWWDFARKFGNPVNMKSYYKVIIPSSTNDGNQDLILYSQTSVVKGRGGTFFLGLENQEYLEQCESLIIEFKKKFYIDQVVKEIERMEAKAKELGKKYDKAILEDKKQDYLNELGKIQEEIGVLREEIKKVEMDK